MKLEIITHCWNYSRLLSYHLAYLSRYNKGSGPSGPIFVKATVVYTKEDEKTSARIDEFSKMKWAQKIEFNPIPCTKGMLLRRSIMRNHIAMRSKADAVWFSDADIVLTEGSVESLVELIRDKSWKLAFPREVNVTSQEDGDRLIENATNLTSPSIMSDVKFQKVGMRKAIGGMQIVTGEVARTIGYCNGIASYQKPSETWSPTTEDARFRSIIGTTGLAASIPGVIRIRHSKRGYIETGVEL